MYGLNHILYTIISILITAILLVLAKKFVKKQKHKDLILILSAVVTVAIHYSGLFYDFFSNHFNAQQKRASAVKGGYGKKIHYSEIYADQGSYIKQ